MKKDTLSAETRPAETRPAESPELTPSPPKIHPAHVKLSSYSSYYFFCKHASRLKSCFYAFDVGQTLSMSVHFVITFFADFAFML